MSDQSNDTVVRSCLLFISFVLGIWSLYVTRDILAPFALAIFIWLIIDAFARWIDSLSKRLPYWPSLAIAVTIVAGAVTAIGFVVKGTASNVAENAQSYQVNLETKINAVFEKFNMESFSVSQLTERFQMSDFIGGAATALQSVVSNLSLIIIYVIFLFAAQSSFPKKIDDLFPDDGKAKNARKVGQGIRNAISDYVGVTTVLALIMTALSYIVMLAVGLENALFWALMIFILNFIPIFGAVASIVLPAAFGFVEFESTARALILLGGLVFVNGVIANIIQPKMMGDSMNLSALVILLALSLWGALWGAVGAFLSAPLTVIIMIILAQFKTTHWMAVLLSANGDPHFEDGDADKDAAKV